MPASATRARTWRSLSNPIVMLLLIASISLAAGLGMRQPSPPDEPRFALAARTMVESGDWLVPHRGRELYAEKPPVFMWTQAASFLAIRNWDIAFLLPSLLAALGTLWLTYDLARRLWGPEAAVYAAGALFVCVQFGLQAKRAQIDMVLVFLTTLSLWGLLRHTLRGPAWGALWVGAFAAGVGTVTKGVGFLPLLALIPWAVARKWGRPHRRRRMAGAGCWYRQASWPAQRSGSPRCLRRWPSPTNPTCVPMPPNCCSGRPASDT